MDWVSVSCLLGECGIAYHCPYLAAVAVDTPVGAGTTGLTLVVIGFTLEVAWIGALVVVATAALVVVATAALVVVATAALVVVLRVVDGAGAGDPALGVQTLAIHFVSCVSAKCGLGHEIAYKASLGVSTVEELKQSEVYTYVLG